MNSKFGMKSGIGIGITITVLLMVFVACAQIQNGANGKIPTPQKIASIICPPTQAALGVLVAPGVLDPKLEAQLAIVTPIVNAVCAAGESVDISSLQNLATTGLPAISKIVAVSTLPDKNKQIAAVGIAVAQAALGQIIQQKTMLVPVGSTVILPGEETPITATPTAPSSSSREIFGLPLE